KALDFKIPTLEMEDLYFKSMNHTVTDYRTLLLQVGKGTLQLTTNDCDTGHATRLGEYALGDATYARLVEELFKRGFGQVKPDLRESLLVFYDSPPPPGRIQKAQKAWHRTASELHLWGVRWLCMRRMFFGAYTSTEERNKNGEGLTGRGFRLRAICTIEEASSCILHMQPSSGGVGAFAPACLCPFLVEPRVRGKSLLIGRLHVFR